MNEWECANVIPARMRVFQRRLTLLAIALAGMSGATGGLGMAQQTVTEPTQLKTGQQQTAQQHYDEAFRLQEAGRIAEADREHKLFLAILLHEIANGRANLGEYGRAVPLYEEALGVTPDDFSLCMDYAGAALDGFDWKRRRRWRRPRLSCRNAAGSRRAQQRFRFWRRR